jgi:hypothetical protein
MAYTMEEIPVMNPNPTVQPNQFNLPVKTFVGYDPKGTTSITGSPNGRDGTGNPTQTITTEETASQDTPAESVKLSPQITALARKEAAQRQREQTFKQQQKEMAAKLADAEKFAQLKQKIAAKDYSAADELGLTYEEYTNYLLNKQAGEKPEDLRYRKVEEELTSLKKAQEETVSREYQANQSLWKQEISRVVKNNEAYPEINFAGVEAESAILQHINDSFEEDNVELTAEQAAKEIEEHLAARALKLAESPTIKKRFEGQGKVLGPPRTAPKTITQNMTVTSQKSTSKPFHLMSESEQIAEAFRRVQAAKQQR